MNRYGIPTTSESSDTCISDSESLAEPKKRYPQRLRMIVTGDVSATSSIDDASIPVGSIEGKLMEQSWAERASQQSSFPEEHAPRASSSSSLPPPQTASNPPASLDACAAQDTKECEETGCVRLSCDWSELDQCLYPVGPVRRTNYRVTFPLIRHLASRSAVRCHR